ncbi:hypothetical protein HDV01_007500 [Terramyces sp. JEL0728]|nr:hypothetical protein HDV01_007500 [Terramyces sp. JEL0728]
MFSLAIGDRVVKALCFQPIEALTGLTPSQYAKLNDLAEQVMKSQYFSVSFLENGASYLVVEEIVPIFDSPNLQDLIQYYGVDILQEGYATPRKRRVDV